MGVPHGGMVRGGSPITNIIYKVKPYDNMIQAIAAEHNKGRRLLIGTMQLDAQRLVIWDMGAIAASGHPDAPSCFDAPFPLW
jgi:hypothetical protein